MHRLFVYLTLLSIAFPAYASPVYPADPDAFSKQWHLQKMEVYEAWSKTQGSPTVTVAVIDTGVDLQHFDLAQNIWINSGEKSDGIDNDGNGFVDDLHGWDFLDGDNNPSPNILEKEVRPEAIHHGTVVAGLIGAVGGNGIGGVGVAPRVKIMPLRALDSRGRGSVTNVIEAINYAVKNGAQIINLSFVGPGFDRDLFVTLQNALRQGVLTVAAVGNKDDNHGQDLDAFPLYPVCYSGSAGEDVVLGVAAVDKQDQKSTFSNFGANCVDVSAPGVAMFSTQYHNFAQGFIEPFGNPWAGSSMAAPLVSGVAALIKSLNPAYAAQEIRNIIVQSADPIDNANSEFKGKLGQGRLNARRALELAIAGGGAVFGPSRGVPYLVTAPYSGAPPEVKVLLGSGTPLRTFMAYNPNFKGGVRLAFGDVRGDQVMNIVTGAGAGGGPHVRIFNPDGTVAGGFFAYDKNFRGGVEVAVGDVDGDGIDEIITASGPGSMAQIKVWSGAGVLKKSFFAYDKRLRGGAKLAVADLDNDGQAEVIVAPGSGLGYNGEIRVFSFNGTLLRSFRTYPASVTGGINVAVGDVSGDSTPEIITSPAYGTLPEVRVYSASGAWQRAFLAYAEGFNGGVNLSVEDIDRDGIGDIIAGPGKGGGPHAKVFDGFGKLKQQFFPGAPDFRGGLSVGVIKL